MRKYIVALIPFLIVLFTAACSSENNGKPATAKENPGEGAAKTASIGAPAPDFTLTDAKGGEHSLSDFKGRLVVLEWVNFDCPFVKKHYASSNMPDLQKTYREKDVAWLSICSSAPGKQGHFKGQALLDRIAAEKSEAFAYLIDSEGKVGKAYNARTTPHMFVIDREGILIYAGGIDDKPSTKQTDIQGAVNYVQKALDAAIAGQEVAARTSEPYGCSVKYK